MRHVLLAIFASTFCFSALRAQIVIKTSTLPGGSLDHVYYQELFSVSMPPLEWSVVPGSGSLPPGLTLSSTVDADIEVGVIEGFPTTPGDYSFTLQVHDSTGGTAQQPYSVSISTITVSTYLPTNVVFSPYSAQLHATGGSGGPYQWSYFVDGMPVTTFSLPFPDSANASFSGAPDGLITGMVTDSIPLPYFVAVTVIAYDPVTQQQSLPTDVNIWITACLVTEFPNILPDAEVGLKYFYRLTYSTPVPDPSQNYCLAHTGIQSMVSGDDLPPGITFDSNGNLTGAPQIAGKYQVAGLAYLYSSTSTSVWNAQGTFPLTLTVLPPPSITTPPVLPVGMAGVPYGPLQFGLTGGTTPYRLTVSGTPPGLSISSSGLLSGTPTTPGNYTISIELIDNLGVHAQPNPEAFQLTITAATPLLRVLTSSLTFAGATGGEAPASRTVAVLPVDDAPASDAFAVVVDGGQNNTPAPNWLSATPATAAAPSHIAVTANQAGLAAGAYSGRVQIIDANGIRNSVTVSLNVSNAAPKLTAAPSILRFTTRASAAATLFQDVMLNNSGGAGPIAWTATISGASTWISSATLNGNRTPSTLEVQVNTKGLPTGSYRDVVHISSANTSIDVPVSLFVAASGPILSLNALGVSFQPSSSTQALQVLNSGDPPSTVHWTASLVSGSDWLNIASPTGAATPSSPGVLSLAPNGSAAGFAAGVHYSLIKISDPNALNSPQYVTAMLNVPSDAASPSLDLDPAGLVFTASAGGAAPPLQQIGINGGPAAAQRVATFTYDGGAWLAASLTSGSVSVSVNPQGLGPGLYAGKVNISADDVLRAANISLIVEPAHCTPAKLALTELNLGDDFAVTSGVPVRLNVPLNDDCGAPVKQASVTASFSNGDSPLQLIGDSLGNYSATWLPGAVTSQMVITLNASSGSLALATASLYGGVAGNQTPPPTLADGGTLNNLNPVVGGALAPGTIAEVFGAGLASSAAPTGTLPLPTTFHDTFAQVGPDQAPLYYVSSEQVNIQIPWELAATQQLPIVLSVNNALTLPVLLDIVQNAPGVLSYFDGPAPPSVQNNAHIIAQHLDGSLVNSGNPGKPGEYLVMYLVGLGATNPSVPSGTATPASPLSNAVNQPTVTVDSIPSKVSFAGLTPYFAGLYQIDFQVPNGVHSGEVVVNVSQGGVAANPTLLAVSQ